MKIVSSISKPWNYLLGTEDEPEVPDEAPTSKPGGEKGPTTTKTADESNSSTSAGEQPSILNVWAGSVKHLRRWADMFMVDTV